MADEPVVEQESQVEQPPPEETPPPTPEQLLQQEREARARLEGELVALREQVRATPPAARPDPGAAASDFPTAERIEAAYQAGQISAEQRAEWRAALIARQHADARWAERQTQAQQQTVEQRTAARLGALIDQHPDLRVPGSALIQKVQAELADLTELGYAPDDKRTQILAVERVVGTGGTVTDRRDFQRRRLPTGGAGGGGSLEPPGGSGAANPLKGIPPDLIADWRRLGANLDDPKVAKHYADSYHARQARRAARAGVAR